MDLRDLENELQRRIGYDYFVTGGLTERGPYLNFNGLRRMLRIWIPRDDAKADEIAGVVKEFIADSSEPPYKEIDLSSS